jgi:lysophospholipase L1-like esterase
MSEQRFRRMAFSAISILLIVSLVSNIALLREYTSDYLDLNATRLDPYGIDTYPSTDAPPKRAGVKRIVFFGDSRAFEWPAPFGLVNVEFVNRGIGAQTTAQVLGRFGAHVAPLSPDVVVVEVGVNDLKAIPLFPERQAAIVERCQANIRQIVTESLHLGAIVVLVTVFPAGAVPLERRPFWSERATLAIEDVNAYIRSLAQDNVTVFEASAVLADRGREVRREYQRDFLHINAAGYAALNQALVPLLENLP